MTQPVSALTTLTNLLTSPVLAFRELNTKPTVLFPLVTLLAANIILLGCFFASVDFAWMIEQMINTHTLDKSAGERAEMEKAMSGLTPLVMGGSAVVGVVLSLLVLFSLMAAYLLLANKLLDSEQLGFKHWFSFTCWCAMPTLFTALASLVNVFLATNGQLSLDALNPISFNNLFFHVAPTDPLFAPISSWDPMMLWNQLLMVVGFSYWMGKPLPKSAVIVLAPTLVIYGIWIAIALV